MILIPRSLANDLNRATNGAHPGFRDKSTVSKGDSVKRQIAS
eukprot:CAMPEP_0204407386 /NCGR_PEP_ID=MMETSP0470-20130426/8732_1 /ASSEMBLY_ACC=CAM_ASM_000385 /TAXON_ID=2969 /ORGANISM="Oxyrrhis marina" /LENGTH=41 /DNA_ID= /DNA_START= /DNA_END= /DNA_ORIENTATION=